MAMKRISFFIDPWLDQSLEDIQRKGSTPKAESIRNAITAYVVDRGYNPKRMMLKAEKRGGTRRKRR